jgi:hypothetical protein
MHMGAGPPLPSHGGTAPPDPPPSAPLARGRARCAAQVLPRDDPEMGAAVRQAAEAFGQLETSQAARVRGPLGFDVPRLLLVFRGRPLPAL